MIEKLHNKDVRDNRLLNAYLLYVEQETQYKIKTLRHPGKDIQADQLKQEYIQDVLNQFKGIITKAEKATRNYLRNESRKLKVRIEPTPINLILYGAFRRWLFNKMFGRREINDHNLIVKQTQKQVAEEQNFININELLKKNGFTNSIDNILEKMIALELQKFHIRYYDIKHPNTDFVLHFAKIKDTMAYSFLRFEVNNKSDNSQWFDFYLQDGLHFTASEAARLVNRKAIYKKENDQWLILNKTNSGPQFSFYSFDLESKLKELPLVSSSNTALTSLANSLKAGTTKEVVLNINGLNEKYFLEASPNNNCIYVKDRFNNHIDLNSLLKGNNQVMEKAKNLLQNGQEKKEGKSYSIRVV